MDVRLLEKEDMPEAKALWKEAFSDSDAFIEWYFKNKVLPGNSMGLYDGGLVSVLHMIPYTIRLQGKPVKSLMIAGAATKQERRGEGHMKELLLEALVEMRSRGIFVTQLYPFKHSFYERFGWATVTHMHRAAVTEAPLRRDVEAYDTDDTRGLEPVYNRMMRGFDGCVVRGSREWRWRMGELKADGGRAVALIQGYAPCAYMLYYANKNKAEVIETAYTDEADVGALLSYLLGKGFKRVSYFLPAQSRGAKSGMARVVNAEMLLRFFGAESLLEDIRIRDGFASWNNICTRSSKQEMDVAELARLVFTGQIPADKGTVPALKRRDIFYVRDTCIFETY